MKGTLLSGEDCQEALDFSAWRPERRYTFELHGTISAPSGQTKQEGLMGKMEILLLFMPIVTPSVATQNHN